MSSLALKRKGALWAGVALATFFVADILAVVLFAAPDAAGHAVFHLIGGTVVGLVGIAIWWSWKPRPLPLARLARRLFVVGFLIMVGGTLLESVGAFAWENEEVKYPVLHTLHSVASVVGPLGMPAMALAALAAVLSRIRRTETQIRPTGMEKAATVVMAASVVLIVLFLLTFIGLWAA